MNEAEPKIQCFGTRGSAEAYAVRDFLYRNGVPFRWIELRSAEQARAEAQVDGLDDQRLPVCVFPGWSARRSARSPRSSAGS
jgi:hypothetical protein